MATSIISPLPAQFNEGPDGRLWLKISLARGRAVYLSWHTEPALKDESIARLRAAAAQMREEASERLAVADMADQIIASIEESQPIVIVLKGEEEHPNG